MKPVACPKCKSQAVATQTAYGIRHACCGLWSWGGKELVSAETHEARKAAHASFDALWKSGGWERSDAYAALAKHLRMAPRDCHIALMDVDLASRVVAWSESLQTKEKKCRY